MRPIALIIILAFLAGACSFSGSKSDRSAKETEETSQAESIPEANLKLVHLEVKGMTCEGCENAVVKSISQLDGIQEASASHLAEEAIVQYDSTRVSMEAIAQAISDAGYSFEGEK